MTEIRDADGSSRRFTTITTHTGLSQRETLEQTIQLLAGHLGIEVVYRRTGGRGSIFYGFKGERGYFQSATNTIFELAKAVADRPA